VIATLTNYLNRTDVRKFIDRFGAWLIIALAGVLRLWNLGYPGKLVFDETYYVKDAWTLWNNGSERSWANDANPAFESGSVNTYLTDPSFVVHPPLGKWIIGLGMWLFGPEHPYSWRITTALLGIAAVGLLIAIAKLIFKSTAWALAAGFLFAIDGHAIVLARTALLDNSLMFFALLAFYFLLRDQQLRDIDRLVRFRPWLFAAGLSLGAATAVKWSGLYFIAAFGIYVVVSETLARRAAGQTNWQTTGLLKQGGFTFANLVPISAVVYLASWSGWIVTSGGYDRNVTGNWFTSLIEYHKAAYGFHVGLHTPHNYAANALSWLFAIRPTSFFYEGLDLGQDSCNTIGGCSSAVTALGNPFIWWPAAASVFFLAVWFVKTRQRSAGIILLGLAGGYLPWLLFLNRTTFQFYAIAFLPWMILALIFVARHYVYQAARPIRAQGLFVLYAALCLLATIFFLPIWNGAWIPYWYWHAHMWLPSWI
jgi:dolichyl-phosphate-mannose--protein O-mannosyl transferase